MRDFFETNKVSIIFCLVFLFISIISVAFGVFAYFNKPVCETNNNSLISLKEDQKEIVEDNFYVEIKGAVKKPGVYKMTKGKIINDVVKLAGGLKNNSYTDNINLSKEVTSEMVIYVYTKSAYKNLNKQNSKTESDVKNTCVTSTYNLENCTNNGVSIIESGDSDTVFNNSVENNETSKDLVNINTASAKELLTLSGIGESKANNIVAYRNENGLFKSTEDIKNVSGIGEALYEQIKANITI